jgi:hypothetical protein
MYQIVLLYHSLYSYNSYINTKYPTISVTTEFDTLLLSIVLYIWVVIAPPRNDIIPDMSKFLLKSMTLYISRTD